MKKYELNQWILEILCDKGFMFLSLKSNDWLRYDKDKILRTDFFHSQLDIPCPITLNSGVKLIQHWLSFYDNDLAEITPKWINHFISDENNLKDKLPEDLKDKPVSGNNIN